MHCLSLAVIPTVGLFGPLALLAMLFPALFGALALWFRRWMVLLTTASLESSLYLAHAWFRPSLRTHWWGSNTFLWALMALVASLGAFWSWRRYRKGAGVITGEKLLLLALGVSCAAVAWVTPRSTATSECDDGKIERWAGTGEPRIAWEFWPRQRGLMASSPIRLGDRVYAAALVFDGAKQVGTVYCLSAATGGELWRFNDGGAMKPVYCTPCVADGRLYIGEGFHQDSRCKMYCLDANSGVKEWEFQTASHTEAGPCVVAGRLYFGAGDDGIYCLDAATGQTRWHYPGRHVDMRVAVVNGRVYAGSGYGTLEMFCLDAKTGRQLWNTPSALPVFAAPVVEGDRVFFGTGNGDLDQSASRPAGALVCLDARTGSLVWRHSVGDAIHAGPIATTKEVAYESGNGTLVRAKVVYCVSRDGHCYCLDQQTGTQIWQRDLGSPLVTTPCLSERWGLYVLTSVGRVYNLAPGTGELWGTELDLASALKSDIRSRSSPFLALTHYSRTESVWLYFGVDARNILNSEPVVLCLEQDWIHYVPESAQ